MIHDPGTGSARRTRELDWLLDDLVGCVREVRHAVVLSNDGLAVGASTGLGREDAEHLAAVASGFHSLAKGAGRHFGAGGVRQTMVEMDDGFLFVAAAGDGSWWPTRWHGWSSGWASTCAPRRAPWRARPPADDPGGPHG